SFTALTLDPYNGVAPGTGWWAGLHVSVDELFAQYVSQAPPFVGFLDGSGDATFALTGLPPTFAGLTVYGVTTTYIPAWLAATANTNVATVTLQ
ncbi:MAG TPA: hypothetical protein VEI02_01200, partial [Planctomycetota bacterium]|nr:hypothetical protein [Planctomycetota bacterium]